jgi:hypothetical protein
MRASFKALLIGSYMPKYTIPLHKCALLLRNHGWRVCEMYKDKYYKEDILRVLQKGFKCIIYFGHGKAGALSGYNGITIAEIKILRIRRPSEMAFCLNCSSLEEKKGISFAEALVNYGVARLAVGYKSKVRYEDNLNALTAITERLCHKSLIPRKRSPDALEILTSLVPNNLDYLTSSIRQ